MIAFLTFLASVALFAQTGPATSRRHHFLGSSFQLPLWGVGSLQSPDTPFVRMKNPPTAGYVRECLTYNPETGTLIWRERPRKHFPTEAGWRAVNARQAKTVAGCQDTKGYIRIRIADNLCHGHRLAWLLTHGAWPKKHIDHVNGNKWDNRIINLREATVSENLMNSKTRVDSASGVKGVHQAKRDGRWQAYLRVDGRKKLVGVFSTKEDAEKRVREARMAYHGEFTNHG